MDGDIILLSPIITAIVEAVKKGLGVPSKLCPFVAMGVGVLLAFLTQTTPSVSEKILLGIVAGLAASGLYSAVGKPVIEGATRLLNSGS